MIGGQMGGYYEDGLSTPFLEDSEAPRPIPHDTPEKSVGKELSRPSNAFPAGLVRANQQALLAMMGFLLLTTLLLQEIANAFRFGTGVAGFGGIIVFGMLLLASTVYRRVRGIVGR